MNLPEPTRVRCACGYTWVFLGWPIRPCGRCGERVTLAEEEDDE